MGMQKSEAKATNAGSPNDVAADALRKDQGNGQATGADSKQSEDGDMIEVRLPAQSRYAVVARQAVESVCGELNMPASDRAAVRLAVGEACNNAILHAPIANDAHTPIVTVLCRILRDALEIDVTNEGTAILPTVGSKMPDPLSESGRGVALIETMMDSVQYLCHHGQTTVRMRKNRIPHDAVAAA